MTQQRSPAELVAEASSEETRSFVPRMKRVSRRKHTPEEGVGIVPAGFRGEVRVTGRCCWQRVPSGHGESGRTRRHDDLPEKHGFPSQPVVGPALSRDSVLDAASDLGPLRHSDLTSSHTTAIWSMT